MDPRIFDRGPTVVSPDDHDHRRVAVLVFSRLVAGDHSIGMRQRSAWSCDSPYSVSLDGAWRDRAHSMLLC
jgi:hypothetical protein